jgi:hypothetical protein
MDRAGVRPWRTALTVSPASVLGGLVGAPAVSVMSTTVHHTRFGLRVVGLADLTPYGRRRSANR